MNKRISDVLCTLKKNPGVSQRALARLSGHSLGIVNKALKYLSDEGYITADRQLTERAYEKFAQCAPKNAIILAAGFGMRMVPINLSAPKAMLEVKGEILIERLIRQLHEAGITDITVVTGFMKESFDYLIDDFGADLIVNRDYASKNNLHSLALAADRIHNTYILPCDIRCRDNPFSADELYSWYMVADEPDEESTVRISRKMELVKTGPGEKGCSMIGISYLTEPDASAVRKKLKEYDSLSRYDGSFWEETLYEKDRMTVQARIIEPSKAVEINTYEQLRSIDSDSNHLHSDAITVIAKVMNVKPEDVKDISVLKKGMTNRSFLFSVNGRKYIMRIPGEGTDRLISRRNEAAVYQTIKGLGLCDDPVYINPDNGYKITSFLDGVRVCDPENTEDLILCMKRLRSFHEMKLQVPHTFDIFGQIEFYEQLREGQPSAYRDYQTTKNRVMGLKSFIDKVPKEFCLTHIDAVPDNFLFYTPEGSSQEQLQLTDWEYAGMQDPHVDIAMFIIYSLYDRQQADRLIDIYFENSCPDTVRAKIYCYIAMCGLLWSNWCEFKSRLGVEFGEYSLRQYRYAKDYCRYAKELTEKSSL